MRGLRQSMAPIAVRGAALMLCLVALPLWAARIALRIFTGKPKRPFPAPGLWRIAKGEYAFIGPAPGEAPAGSKPGLVSPAALRRRMGIAHTADGESDAAFFARASLRQRWGLLLRHVWSCLLSAREPAGSRDAHVFGVRIDAVSMPGAVDRIIDACDARNKRPMQRVAFVNPDCLNKAMRDRDYHHLLNRADLVLPDGIGLRIAARLLRLPLVDNVNGTDMLPLLCERAVQTGKRLFLYGGLPGVALDAAERLREAHPGLEIVGCLDGYSHRKHQYAVINAINASGADIVLAGLGAPRQERWLFEHRHSLQTAVGIGVGGLFDYHAGRVRRAPLWLREIGLEWLWRILEEPKAKWRRYVLGNPLFIARVLRERWWRRKATAARPSKPGSWTARHETARQSADRPKAAVRRRWRRGLLVRRVAKRVLDILLAAAAIVALAPLLLTTAALIKLESPGPVLFRQWRVGRRGRAFPMYKFRSMFIDAEARLAELAAKNESGGGVLFKMKEDPRVTRVGRIIRRYSIDELPQLINILRGEMSIVGPRPALPAEVEQYSAADRKRLQAKPGLTCLWQIGGRSDLSFEEQVGLDLNYLKGQNVLTDIEIIAKTVPAVINGKGAY